MAILVILVHIIFWLFHTPIQYWVSTRLTSLLHNIYFWVPHWLTSWPILKHYPYISCWMKYCIFNPRFTMGYHCNWLFNQQSLINSTQCWAKYCIFNAHCWPKYCIRCHNYNVWYWVKYFIILHAVESSTRIQYWIWDIWHVYSHSQITDV